MTSGPASPESVGWSPLLLERAEAWTASSSTTALLVAVGGRTIVELDRPLAGPGAYSIDGAAHLAPDIPVLGLPFEPLPDGRMRHDVASAQKSVVALLCAAAADRNLVGFDDAVTVHLGEGWSQAAPEHESAVTLRHLLSMTSGLDDQLRTFAPPGAAWRYGLGPTWHLLKRVLVRASGLSLQDLTDEWLGAPIGLAETTWIARPGMAYLDGEPFEALCTSARELARIGLLVLGQGSWGDRAVISPARVAELLAPSQELNPAYGLLWWLNGRAPIRVPLVDEPIDRILLPDAPFDTVAMQGALGQLCFVVPSLDAVVVRLGSSSGMVGAGAAEELWRDVLAPSLPGTS